MKYLKRFNESVDNDIEDIKSDLNDMALELIDDGYEFDIDYLQQKKTPAGTRDILSCTIHADTVYGKDAVTEDIYNFTLRVLDYMLSNGWGIPNDNIAWVWIKVGRIGYIAKTNKEERQLDAWLLVSAAKLKEYIGEPYFFTEIELMFVK